MDQASTQVRDDHLDRIVYLASLVSNKHEIEPYLEKLRALTARLRPDSEKPANAMVAGDHNTLTQLERDLKDYLVHREPLRAFTNESLDQRLYERLQAGTLIRKLRWQMVAVVGAAALFTAIITALPPIADSGKQSEIIGTTFIAGLYLGAVYLFISCLKQFSPALQAAYRMYAYGFVVGASTVLLSVVMAVVYSIKTPWEIWWFTTLGFPISYIMFYSASRRLALLQQVQSPVLNWKFVTSAVLVVTTLIALMPGGRAFYETDGITAWLSMLNVGYIVCYNWALFKSWQQSTERYKYSTRALTISTFSGLIGWALMLVRTFVPSDTAILLSNISDLCSVIALIFLLRAGYLLNKLSRQ